MMRLLKRIVVILLDLMVLIILALSLFTLANLLVALTPVFMK